MGLRDRIAAEDGFSAGAEVLLFGSLIFFVGLLLVVNVWNIIDADMAVTAAAKEAARTYVEADSAGGAEAAANAAAHDTLQSLGRLQPATVSLAGSFSRCQPVTATVVMSVDPVRMPGGFFGTTFEVNASHTEIVDPYRSGLPGTAVCQ